MKQARGATRSVDQIAFQCTTTDSYFESSARTTSLVPCIDTRYHTNTKKTHGIVHACLLLCAWVLHYNQQILLVYTTRRRRTSISFVVKEGGYRLCTQNLKVIPGATIISCFLERIRKKVKSFWSKTVRWKLHGVIKPLYLVLAQRNAPFQQVG